MERLFRLLRPAFRAVAAHPFVVLLVTAVVTAALAPYALQLRVDSDFANLLPSSYPSVQALERLQANVGGEQSVSVAVESPDPAANRRYIEALIPRVLAMRDADGRPYFTRVEYRRDTEFLAQNALYFATNAELDSLDAFLDGVIQKSRLEANPFYFDVGDLEGQEEQGDSARIARATTELQASYRRIVGKPLPISDDSLTIGARFYPSGSFSNIGYIDALYADLQRTIDAVGPKQYHPWMTVTSAGRPLKRSVEVHVITDDVIASFGSGVALVILLVVGYFGYRGYVARAGHHWRPRTALAVLARTPALALVIGLPLLASLVWTGALAHLQYGALNLMTSTLGLVLFGMGIDYGIHFYGRYAEERGHGVAPFEAALKTFESTGEAITTTALTTAAAFFIFLLADFRGFSEFGFIAGVGILNALVSMLVVLPALLLVFERFRLVTFEADADVAEARQAGPAASRIPRAGLILGAFGAFLLLSLLLLPRLRFEYDFGKLDRRYPAYENRESRIYRVFGGDRGRRNPAYIVTDSPDEVPAIEAALRARMANDPTPTIGVVETLQSRYPSTPAEAEAKLARIAGLRTKLADPAVAASGSADLLDLRAAASTVRPIPLDSIPESVKRGFISKQGVVGNLVVIYPRYDRPMANGRNSIAFQEDVGAVQANGRTYHAGSTSLVAADMLVLMREETPLMVVLTLVLVVLFKVLSLRSLKWALVALAPLLLGFVGMFGVMVLVGWKLNFYNLIVLPAVLGIGDDAGIHLVHRYQEEGPGSMRRILRTTGASVFMSAVTAIVGFGGQVLSSFPGLRSIGETAIVGIGMTLLTAVVFLPALIQWLEDHRGSAPGALRARVAERFGRPAGKEQGWWRRAAASPTGRG